MSAESYFALAPLIIFLPVAGLLVNLALGRRLGERFTGIVASSAVGLGFGVAVLQFLALQAEPEGARVAVAEWIRIGDLAAPWALKIDSLAVTMLLMVTGVSTLIHILPSATCMRTCASRATPAATPASSFTSTCSWPP